MGDKVQIVYKPIDEIIPYVNNPRNNEHAVDAVASSIKNFNDKVPTISCNSKRVNFYFMSNTGHFFSFWNNGKIKPVRPRTHTSGYHRYQIDGKDFYAHRLVAQVYISNPKNLKEVNHLDGNKENNSFNNLEWCTRQENNKHAFSIGLRSRSEMEKMANSENHKRAVKKSRTLSDGEAVAVKKLIACGETDAEIARTYGVSRGCVWNLRTGNTYKEIVI